MDPALASAFTLTLEKSANAALIYDASTRYKLKQLSQCVFHFVLNSPELSLYMEIAESENDEGKILFAAYSEKNVTCQINGTLLDFLSLLGNPEIYAQGNISSLANSGIRVQGNTAKLAILQDLFKNMDIDWEQALIDFSSPLGEGAKVVSHQFAEAIKHFLNWQKAKAQNMQDNMVQFLLDELKVLPNKIEFKEFSSEVAELRAAGDRLQARVSRFLQREHSES